MPIPPGNGRPGRSAGSAAPRPGTRNCIRDPLHLLNAGRVKRGTSRTPEQTPPELREPLATLGLSWPTTLDAVKTRYKELAKRHHPDANGGDRAAEERLKTINLAYAAVRSRLVIAPSVAATG